MPLKIIAFLQNKQTHETICVQFDLDQEEIIDAFETLSKEQGSDPIHFEIDIPKDMNTVNLILSKGAQKIELNKGNATQRDVTSGYKPSVPS